VLIRAKQHFLLKNSLWLSKNAEFHSDFKSARLKSFEKCTKKSLNMTEICTFSLLLMFVKLVLLITFLVHCLTTFSMDLKSARNSAFLIYFFI
jgi:hypothetical protein